MRIPSLVAVSATALLTLSACGMGSSGAAAQQPGSSASASASGSGSGSGISVAHTSLGKVLVNGKGMTLYMRSADRHDHSTCSNQCLQFWPALSPGGSAKISAATGHTTTPGGTPIETVAGHPVYTFSQDQKPGDVNGDGVNEFGGTWYAVSPSGQPVMRSQAPSGGSSSSSSGKGY
jgi:predicted lipoprotein with Yx(FWY)xxD motif